jgi:hypothetical protein
VPSRHTQFSVAFTTNIAESNFRYTQDRRDWAALDHPDDRLALAIIELAGAPRRLAVQKTVENPVR